MSTIKCPSCGHPNIPGKFCQECGEKLVSTIRCRRCKAENLSSAKFCRECGIEIASATVGLGLKRAKAWMNWFSDYYETLHHSWIEYLNNDFKEENSAILEENEEVIILSLPISKKDWGFDVRCDWGDEFWVMKDGQVIWTDWRLIIAGDAKSQHRWTWCPYQNITGFSYKDDDLTLIAKIDNEVKLKLHFNRYKRGFVSGLVDRLLMTPAGQLTTGMLETQVHIRFVSFQKGFHEFVAEVVNLT